LFSNNEKYLGLTLKGRYRLESFLGEGISGMAFLAYDSLLEGWVVVKIIKDEIEGFPIPLGEEWTEEPKKAMQVRSHPHISAILDLGYEDAVSDEEKTRIPYIVWEYIDGTLLQEFLTSDKELGLHELFELSLQLCSTLQFLQAKKLSHGDLHSRNVMLLDLPEGERTIKLIDFGVARNVLTGRARQDDISGVLKILGQLVDKYLSCGPAEKEAAAGFEMRDLVRRAGNLLPAGKMSLAELQSGIELLQQHFNLSGDVPDGNEMLRLSHRTQGRSEQLPDFFGRRAEMGILLEAARKAFSHRLSRHIFLLGETGSGKSAALHRVIDELSRTGEAVVFDYSVNQADQQKPFSALIGFWRRIITPVGGKTRLQATLENFPHVWEHFRDKLPEMFSLFSVDELRSGGGLLAPELAKELNSFLIGAAKLIPIAIAFDDIHTADHDTLSWLLNFKTGEAGVSLACLFTLAPGELNFVYKADESPLRSLPKGDPYTTIVELQPLSSKDVEDLVSSEFTFIEHPEYSRFVRFLMAESGGEPFYVSEIIKACIDEGLIGGDGSKRWEFRRDTDGFVLPKSIEAHVARRMMRLSQHELSLIKWATYFGPLFPAEGVRATCGLEDELFASALQSLANQHHLIKQLDDTRWAFAQPPVRKILLKGIPFGEKRAGLEAVARWQIGRARQVKAPAFLMEVAQNLNSLGRYMQAGGFAVAAARGCLRKREYEAALDAAEEALMALPFVSSATSRKALQSIALQAKLDASMNLCRYDETLTICDELSRLSDENGDIELALQASLRKALALRLKCAYSVAEGQVLETIKLARRLDHPKFEGEALRELGTVRYLKGEFEEAVVAFLQSAKVLDEIGEVHSAAKTYNNLGLVYKQMGDYAPMEESLRMSVAKYREANDRTGERLPLANLGLFHQQVGRFDEAKRCFEDILNQLDPDENSGLEAKARLSLAQVQSSIGLTKDASRSAESALTLFTEMKDKQGQAETMSLLGDIALDSGQYNLAKEYHKRSLKLKEEIGSEMGICHSKLRLARVAMHEAKFDIAIGLAKEVTERAKEKGWTKLTIESITETIRAISERDGPDAALEILQENTTQEGMVGDPAMVLLDFYLTAAKIYIENDMTSEAARFLNAFEERYSRVFNSMTDAEVQRNFAEKMSRQISLAADLQARIGETGNVTTPE